MTLQYYCKNEQRQAAIRALAGTSTAVDECVRLNGIDYLEVSGDQKTLKVFFIHSLCGEAAKLTPENVEITGGTRLRSIAVETVEVVGNLLLVGVAQVGDFSDYALQLVGSPFNPEPPAGIDPQLATVTFSFWVDEVSELDCAPDQAVAADSVETPVIDYLAKDYASFRQLMLDRLAVTAPDWQERSPADVGVMLVELLAYSADHLSYYQDAVATEAYLGMARRRVSVRRHARLLDYFMHDGCNARAWVVLTFRPAVNEKTCEILSALEGVVLRGPDRQQNRPGTQFLSSSTLSPGVLSESQIEAFDGAVRSGAQIFESLHDLTLSPLLSQLYFYTWGDQHYDIPQGATQATLLDATGQLPCVLAPGRILAFEEVIGGAKGKGSPPEMSHRHVVRLTGVRPKTDPLTQQSLVVVEWAVEDALPFALSVSRLNEYGQTIENVSVAYGNVVLADAGRTREVEPLPVQQPESQPERQPERHPEKSPRPRLKEWPLTRQGYVQNSRRQWVHFDAEASATAAMRWEMRDVKPAIALWEDTLPDEAASENPAGGARWQARADLLSSDRFARDFVVETETDQRTFLRFGDGTLGKRPAPDRPLLAVYRTGSGRQGNVGAHTISTMMLRSHNLSSTDRHQLSNLKSAIQTLYNPLAAAGGTEPEAISEVRRNAPQAFRTQRRAVTAADYGETAQQYPGVQRALATRRWTGSWHTMFITVDREEGRPVDDSFKAGLLAFLETFRLAGHDIEIESPRFVPLDIVLSVQVAPNYFQSTVKKALLETFSNQRLPDGRLGFFSSDNFTFGQPVYLSKVVKAAVQITGIQSVRVTRFQRWGETSQQSLDNGVIRCDRLEIAQLNNASASPENGRLQLHLEGGL